MSVHSKIRWGFILLLLAAGVLVYTGGGKKITSSLQYLGYMSPPPPPENLLKGSVTVSGGGSPHTTEYFAYVPIAEPGETLPVLVGLPGYNGSGAAYMTAEWREIADEKRYVILAPSFRSPDADFDRQASYHYPKVWSARALDAMLQQISENPGVDVTHVYMYGFSAGAQFAHRYALLRPNTVVAAAVHSAGGFTFPSTYVPTRFFITVGQLDADRMKGAFAFVEKAQAKGITAELRVWPDVGHGMTPEHVPASLAFFDQSRESR